MHYDGGLDKNNEYLLRCIHWLVRESLFYNLCYHLLVLPVEPDYRCNAYEI